MNREAISQSAGAAKDGTQRTDFFAALYCSSNLNRDLHSGASASTPSTAHAEALVVVGAVLVHADASLASDTNDELRKRHLNVEFDQVRDGMLYRLSVSHDKIKEASGGTHELDVNERVL